MLSRLSRSFTPSPIFALDATVKELQKQGIPVVNLCIGEPDFDTPSYIQNAAYQAMQEGYTHYSSGAGLFELREIIADKFFHDNGLRFKTAEIVVTQGSKSAIYIIFLALLDPGDEVIIPIPAWSSYVEMVKVAGGKPVLHKLKPPFKVTAESLENSITKNTKIILINSPSNPTGSVIEKHELLKIAYLAKKYNLYIISDEIYEKLIYRGKHVSIASLNRDIRERTITVNGFSKAYAMTGWRIGYAAGVEKIISAVSGLQSQIASSAVTFAQVAGITALQDNPQELLKMQREFAKRRNFITQEFRTISGIDIIEPEGAFYLFASVKRLLGKKYRSSAAWCERLLEKEHVAVTPGEAFFYPKFFRLCFASSMENLEKAVEGIKRFINNTK